MESEVQYLETEHGTFTNNETTGQTAEEVYQEWLANKDIPPTKEDDKIDILEQQLATAKQGLTNLQIMCINLQKQIILK